MIVQEVQIDETIPDNQGTLGTKTAQQFIFERTPEPVQQQQNRFYAQDLEGNPVIISLPTDAKFITLQPHSEKSGFTVSSLGSTQNVLPQQITQTKVFNTQAELAVQPVVNSLPEKSSDMNAQDGTLHINEDPTKQDTKFREDCKQGYGGEDQKDLSPL